MYIYIDIVNICKTTVMDLPFAKCLWIYLATAHIPEASSNTVDPPPTLANSDGYIRCRASLVATKAKKITHQTSSRSYFHGSGSTDNPLEGEKKLIYRPPS